MSRIDAREARTQEELNSLREKKIKIIQKLLIKCPKCNISNRASKWTFLQSKYWHCPSSWQSGGFWLNREIYVCDAVCPSCDSQIYIYNHRPLLILVNHIKERNLRPQDIFKKIEVGDLEGTNRVLQAVERGRISVTP